MTKSTDSLTAAIYELRNSTCFCNRWIHQDVFYLLLSSTQLIQPNLSAISIARLLPKLVIGLDDNNMPNNLGIFRQRKKLNDKKNSVILLLLLLMILPLFNTIGSITWSPVWTKICQQEHAVQVTLLSANNWNNLLMIPFV